MRRAPFLKHARWMLAVAPLALIMCRTPTEIVLDVRTDVPCASGGSWSGTAIYVGSPGDDVETKAPTLITTRCDANGEIGTLVITPSGAKDDLIGIRVVAGLTRAPEDCADAAYDGCIVERRSLRFLPSTSVPLVVSLPAVCTGVGCAPGQTCQNGACIDSFTAVGSTPQGDGGPSALGVVKCGATGLHCPMSGAPCCLSAVTDDAGTTDGGTIGACIAKDLCPVGKPVVECDSSRQCAGFADDAGQPFVCCKGSIGGFFSFGPIVRCMPQGECLAAKGFSEMCTDRLPCVSGNPCRYTLGAYLFCAGF